MAADRQAESRPAVLRASCELSACWNSSKTRPNCSSVIPIPVSLHLNHQHLAHLHSHSLPARSATCHLQLAAHHNLPFMRKLSRIAEQIEQDLLHLILSE